MSSPSSGGDLTKVYLVDKGKNSGWTGVGLRDCMDRTRRLKGIPIIKDHSCRRAVFSRRGAAVCTITLGM